MHAVAAPPSRSLAQRLSALERANGIRTSRARLKRDLKAGRADLFDLLASPPADWLETMKVAELMLAAPKYGRVKVNKLLARTRISPSKSLGGLTDRQRIELLAELRR